MTATALAYILSAVILVSGVLALYGALPRPAGQRALRWLVAGLLASPVANAAPAIYHCELDGRVSYQDTPCEIDATTLRVMPILKPPPEVPLEPAAVAAPPPGVVPPAGPRTPAIRRGNEPDAIEVKPALEAKPAFEAKPRIERVEPTQFNRDKRTAEVRKASPECQGLLGQIAAQKEMLYSLRAETRTQARSKVDALTRELRAQC